MKKPIVVTKADAVYKILLNLYPKAYRQLYGQQMFIVFRDLYREQITEGEKIGIGFWIKIISDTVSSLIQQYAEVIKEYSMETSNKKKLFNVLKITSGLIILVFVISN